MRAHSVLTTSAGLQYWLPPCVPPIENLLIDTLVRNVRIASCFYSPPPRHAIFKRSRHAFVEGHRVTPSGNTPALYRDRIWSKTGARCDCIAYEKDCVRWHFMEINSVKSLLSKQRRPTDIHWSNPRAQPHRLAAPPFRLFSLGDQKPLYRSLPWKRRIWVAFRKGSLVVRRMKYSRTTAVGLILRELVSPWGSFGEAKEPEVKSIEITIRVCSQECLVFMIAIKYVSLWWDIWKQLFRESWVGSFPPYNLPWRSSTLHFRGPYT